MSKVYDVVATVGEYTDREGNTKKRFANIGAVFKSDKGFSIKLESVPVGWNGWANFYEPKPKGEGYDWKGAEQREAANKPAPRQASPSDFDDDINF